MLRPEWFAGRLREIREAAGLSRDELGQRAGLCGRGIEGLEQGRRLPQWATVLAICNALAIEPTAFCRAPAERPPPRGGRPRKTPAGPPPVKRPVGRPRKASS